MGIKEIKEKMTKEQIKEKAKDFVSKIAGGMPKEMDYYADILVEFATEVTKELEKENSEMKADNDARKFAMDMSGKVEKQLREENAELRKVAEFQQSSNMSIHFENKKLKEGLAVGSIFNKALNSMNKNLKEEREKYRNMVFDKDEQLTKAREIIKQLCLMVRALNNPKVQLTNVDYSLSEAEQFLSEVEK